MAHHQTHMSYEKVDLVVEYNYYPPSYGAREHGVPIEPDESAVVEISDISVKQVDLLGKPTTTSIYDIMKDSIVDYLEDELFDMLCYDPVPNEASQ